MQTFAVGLGMDKHYFDHKFDRHITNFSALRSLDRRQAASSAGLYPQFHIGPIGVQVQHGPKLPPL
jgi:hypothetical protein